MTDIHARHQAWLTSVENHLSQQDEVVGLVAFGSTANMARVDEWSDHDLAIVVREGTEEHYRDGAVWLPHLDDVVMRTVEHHGGGKAMYANGHLVEWGVATVDGLRDWLADDYGVLLDRGGVTEVMQDIATRPHVANEPQLARDVSLFMFGIMHGVGRERRGESVSAGYIIRSEAAMHLMRAVKAALPPVTTTSADRLNHHRRIEADYPDVASEISRACALPVEECARALVALAVDQLGVGPEGVPQRALNAVTTRLGWPAVS